MTQRIDWHAVFQDFAYLGMTGEELAEHTGLRSNLLQRVATGRQAPAPGAAARIASLWCELVGKPAAFLPTTREPEGTLRPEVAGIDSNDEVPQSYAQLEALTFVWAQVIRR